MTAPNDRDGGRAAQPWDAVLLPRFAWLAERLPWFAAPVAFHAWPWIGRLVVWGGVACTIAVVGHAWMGGLAWHRATPADQGVLAVAEDVAAQSGTSSPTLFADEALADVSAQPIETRLPRMTEGVSDAALTILRFAGTAADSEASDADTDTAHAAIANVGGEDASDAAVSSAATLRWARFSVADRAAAIVSGTRAEAALSGLRHRARTLGLVAASPRDDSARTGAGAVVTQWGQWISETAKRHDVSVDRFVVDERSASLDVSVGDGDSAAANTRSAMTALNHRSLSEDVDEGVASRSGLDAMESVGDPLSVSPRPLQQGVARIAIRGAFEPMAAFLAALGAASPPVIVQAAQIMPDHGSKGSRLAMQAVLFFIDADKPRMASGVAGAGSMARPLHASGRDARAAQALGRPVPASDAAVPANPFQRRGQAQTDIVVLATYASGGQRAVLLGRYGAGLASRGLRASRSGATARNGGEREQVALARAGETFADVRVMAIEADRVRLRPLLGGGDLDVRLMRQDSAGTP